MFSHPATQGCKPSGQIPQDLLYTGCAIVRNLVENFISPRRLPCDQQHISYMLIIWLSAPAAKLADGKSTRTVIRVCLDYPGSYLWFGVGGKIWFIIAVGDRNSVVCSNFHVPMLICSATGVDVSFANRSFGCFSRRRTVGQKCPFSFLLRRWIYILRKSLRTWLTLMSLARFTRLVEVIVI